MAKDPDDEDDELIDMPPFLASAPPMSILEDRVEHRKIATCIISHRLSVVTRVGCPVCLAPSRVSTS